jgi:hypothetical protein
MNNMFKEARSFNQDLTIWQALSNDLDYIALNYCKDLTPEYINSYISKKELELREKLTSEAGLTKTGRLGRKKKDLETIHTDSFSIPIRQYRLLSNFKALKNRLQAIDLQNISKELSN